MTTRCHVQWLKTLKERNSFFPKKTQKTSLDVPVLLMWQTNSQYKTVHLREEKCHNLWIPFFGREIKNTYLLMSSNWMLWWKKRNLFISLFCSQLLNTRQVPILTVTRSKSRCLVFKIQKNNTKVEFLSKTSTPLPPVPPCPSSPSLVF